MFMYGVGLERLRLAAEAAQEPTTEAAQWRREIHSTAHITSRIELHIAVQL